MCQRKDVTEVAAPTIGSITFSPLSEKERLHEIDMRVGARLMEKELYRAEYMRGFLDCFYLVVIAAWAVYLIFFWGKEE